MTKKTFILLLLVLGLVIFSAFLVGFKNEILLEASRHGLTPLARLCLRLGANPDFNILGYTPLNSAITGRHAEVFLLLLAAKANVKDIPHGLFGDTPLNTAIKNGGEFYIKHLIEAGADIHTMGYNREYPIHVAVSNCDPEMTRFILEKGASPNSRGQSGYTPLHYAMHFATKNRGELVKILLEAGADPNARDNENATAFLVAVKNHDQPSASLMLERKAEINATDSRGITPLRYAISTNSPEFVKKLLEHGADPNQADNSGETPLHHAARNNYQELIKLLASHGADINATDKIGRNAWIFAHQSARPLLEQLGCRAIAELPSETTAGPHVSTMPAGVH